MILAFVIVAALLALGFAAINFFVVKKMDEGTEQMKEIASAIRVGANAFLRYEYKVLALIVACIVVALCVFVNWQTAVAFVIGAVMSLSLIHI